MIPARSLVLVSQSSYFKTILDSAMQGQPNAEIRVPDCSPRAFRCMLEWVYTGKLCFEDDGNAQDPAVELLQLSEKYQLTGLKVKLASWMCSRCDNLMLCPCIM